MNWRIIAVAIAALVQADGPAEPLPHCGIGCAYAILRHFGVDVSVATLEREMAKLDPEADLGRLTLPHLSRLIRAHGLHTRTVLADLRDLEHIPTPAILLLDKGPDGTETTVGHVVLLQHTTAEGAEITDLTLLLRGTRFIPTDRLLKMSQGRLLLVSDRPISLPVNWVATTGILVMVVAAFGLARSVCRQIRLKKDICCIGLVLAALCAGEGCKSQRPPLKFENRMIDKGTFRHGIDGNAVSGEFPFVVADSTQITIEAVQTTCGCMAESSNLVGVPLKASSRHVVALRLDTKDRVGLYEGKARIVTRPSSPTRMILEFRVFVVPLPKALPARVLATCSVSEPPQDIIVNVVRVRDSHTRPLALCEERSDWGIFALKNVASRTDAADSSVGSVRETVTLTMQAPATRVLGDHVSNITVAWENGVPPTVIPATFRVTHPVSLQVSRLYLGQISRGTHRFVRLRMESTDQSTLEDAVAQCDVDFLHANVDPAERILTLEAKTPEQLGRFEACVHVRFPNYDLPSVDLAVSGIVVE